MVRIRPLFLAVCPPVVFALFGPPSVWADPSIQFDGSSPIGEGDAVPVARGLESLHGTPSGDVPQKGGATPSAAGGPFPGGITTDQAVFLEDLMHREYQYFAEQCNKKTGLCLDHSNSDGSKASDDMANTASIAATGFGLTAHCIASAPDHRWVDRASARRQVLATLTMLWNAKTKNGWYNHFLDADTADDVGVGKDAWDKGVISSVDTALLLGGVLTVRQCFKDDGDEGREIYDLAGKIYDRVDFPWMLDGKDTFSMGWEPDPKSSDGSGKFMAARYNVYSEALLLNLLAVGSKTHPVDPSIWRKFARPEANYNGVSYVQGPSDLFTHHYPWGYFDVRGLVDSQGLDYEANAKKAIQAQQRWFKNEVASEFAPTFRQRGEENPYMTRSAWGLTSSSCNNPPNNYCGWGGPPRPGRYDGTIVRSAPGGSLAVMPKESAESLMAMSGYLHDRFPDADLRYGLPDAIRPAGLPDTLRSGGPSADGAKGWLSPTQLGINIGPDIIAWDNLKNGRVWQLFMDNPEARIALDRVGFKRKSAVTRMVPPSPAP